MKPHGFSISILSKRNAKSHAGISVKRLLQMSSSSYLLLCLGAGFLFLAAPSLADHNSKHTQDALQDIDAMINLKEDDRKAPVDFGFGPGILKKTGMASTPRDVRDFTPLAVSGGASAHIQGVFTQPFTWPIIPIQVALLPDGRVLSYGTDETGRQGAQLIHAIWDPSRGMGPESHTVLQNTTSTDLFCAAQSLIAQSGAVLITGGSMIINGIRNYSTADTNFFNYRNNVLSAGWPMNYKRWYPTLVTLASGEMLVLGGREEKDTPVTFASIPEVYNPSTGWRTLRGAQSENAYGSLEGSWFYPRAFQAPNGKVFVMNPVGKR